MSVCTPKSFDLTSKVALITGASSLTSASSRGKIPL